MADTTVLQVLLHARIVAEIVRVSNGRHELRYADDWRQDPQAHPVSLSLPLSQARHGDRALMPFLWGLLPDNTQTLRHYARTYGVSEHSPVALLTQLGEDCAGAVQFVTPDRSAAIIGQAETVEAEWIDEREIAQELRTALQSGMPALTPRSAGRFSLAGAQPKIALLRHNGRYGRPIGRTPTTHILKPPSPTFPGFAENEHLCLQVAQALGLRAANSSVERFGDEVAIVVERYDRLWTGQAYRRLHQEDCCQAFGVMPDRKYESDGGPGLVQVVRFIEESSQNVADDRQQFLDAAILNWVIAATDAHAKNFSFLHIPGQRVRLAPLYDIASYLPYDAPPWHDVRLAMRVHNEYQIKRITLHDWLRMGRKAGLDDDMVVERIRSILARLPDAITDEVARATAAHLDGAALAVLADWLRLRVRECTQRIDAAAGNT